MKAIILAAGFGSRLRPLTDNSHKSLLPVAGVSIMERMLRGIESAGITEIAIVTGYRNQDIENFVPTLGLANLNVTFIHSDKFLVTNTGYSLLLCKDFIGNSAFVKFDADVVFEPEVLKKLVNHPGETCLCIDKNIHLDKEEVKVIADSNDMVMQVGKKLDATYATGESIGIEKISATAGQLLFAELEKLMQDEKNYQEYYDDSYTTLVNQGVKFYAADITGLKWVEVDTHEDYARAQEIFKN